MADVSIIARRLADGHVQYGWSGNGGYYRRVGEALLTWYNTPEMVEYLFSLGQLKLLTYPPTPEYEQHWFIHTTPTGEPHYLGTSEVEIFGRIAFVDYGYFYDIDQRWYAVYPSSFCVKIPLEEVKKYIERTGERNETKFFKEIQAHILLKITDEWYENDTEFRRLADGYGFDRSRAKRVAHKILEPDGTLNHDDEDFWYVFHYWRYFDDHKWLFDYIDRWVVVVPENGNPIGKILMRKREEPRPETIEWV